MKTIKKTRNKGRFTRILLLAITIIGGTSFIFNDATAQEFKSKLEDKEDILDEYKAEKIDTNYTFRWNDEIENWEVYKREIDYLTNGHIFATYKQRFSEEDSAWVNHERSINDYDDNDELVETLHQKWNEKMGEWINLKIKTITYNDRGERREVLHHEWRQAVDQWISTVRYLITYNREGDESNILIQTYSAEEQEWSPHIKYSFSYKDGFGYPDETFVHQWDPYSQTWEPRGKYQMRHDGRGNKTLETHVNYNPSMDKWINSTQYDRDFKKDLLKEEIIRRWNFHTEEWVNAVRNQHEYDEDGELKETTEEQWNRDAEEWVLNNRYLYGDLEEIMSQQEKSNDTEQ
ncbi:MAG: hypothetical protein ACLFUH_01075 [Bacteroidales bacterium]